jgi:hypothetical protein
MDNQIGWEKIGVSGHARPANPKQEAFDTACRLHDKAVDEYIANPNTHTLAAMMEAENVMNTAYNFLMGVKQ